MIVFLVRDYRRSGLGQSLDFFGVQCLGKGRSERRETKLDEIIPLHDKIVARTSGGDFLPGDIRQLSTHQDQDIQQPGRLTMNAGSNFVYSLYAIWGYSATPNAPREGRVTALAFNPLSARMLSAWCSSDTVRTVYTDILRLGCEDRVIGSAILSFESRSPCSHTRPSPRTCPPCTLPR